MLARRSLPTESEQSVLHHLNHVSTVANISLQLASMRMPACMSIGMFAAYFCFFLSVTVRTLTRALHVVLFLPLPH